jgi:hypothetical protein
MMPRRYEYVIPVKTGIQVWESGWIPASAGMTEFRSGRGVSSEQFSIEILKAQ